MDFLDALTSLFSSPSRGRRRTRQEDNARGVALYLLPVLAFWAVAAGVAAIVAIGVLPLLALALTALIAPRLGVDIAGSRRLAIQSACVCVVVDALGLFLRQPLF